MSDAPITTGDINVGIPISLGSSIAAYGTLELILKDPDNAVKVVTCSVDPTDVCTMILTTLTGMFPLPGTWIAQPKLTNGAEVVYGDEFEMEIVDALSLPSGSAALGLLEGNLQYVLTGT